MRSGRLAVSSRRAQWASATGERRFRLRLAGATSARPFKGLPPGVCLPQACADRINVTKSDGGTFAGSRARRRSPGGLEKFCKFPKLFVTTALLPADQPQPATQPANLRRSAPPVLGGGGRSGRRWGGMPSLNLKWLKLSHFKLTVASMVGRGHTQRSSQQKLLPSQANQNPISTSILLAPKHWAMT